MAVPRRILEGFTVKLMVIVTLLLLSCCPYSDY